MSPKWPQMLLTDAHLPYPVQSLFLFIIAALCKPRFPHAIADEGRLALCPLSLSGGLFMRGWISPWAILDSPSRHRFLPPSGSWQDISYLSCTVVVGKGLVRGTPCASAAAACRPCPALVAPTGWWFGEQTSVLTSLDNQLESVCLSSVFSSEVLLWPGVRAAE